MEKEHPPARFIHETGDCFLWAGSPLPRARAAAAGKGFIHGEEKLVIDLDPEKETEMEPEEPQKPGKPSVFIVFQKVWLGYSPQPPPLGKRGLLSPACPRDS